MIADDKVAEIRERTDIVALIGEFVALKRNGRSFKGLCPFHSEKTPSFNVIPDRHFFHCFGCQASGDVITFLMRLEGRTFPDVAKQLAERAGIDLPVMDARLEEAQRVEKNHKERLAHVMDVAAGFYVKMLATHPHAKAARDELEKRAVSDESTASFRLGYAPHGWDELGQLLRKSGISDQEAEEAGLVLRRKSGSGSYDRFRHRLVFPISDIHGRIVAFSGRELPPLPGEAAQEGSAKYVNSPESPLYKKGDILYGLHEGRVALRREGWAVVCEGNFDLVKLHQAGFANAIAPMGTALTESHAKLLKRFVARVVLLFDGDRAGRKAVRAAYPLLRKAGLAARVVTLPGGHDPDTYLREHGEPALRSLIDASPGIVEHLIDDAAAEAAGDARAVADAVSGLGPVIATAEPVELDRYIERIGRRFDIRDLQAVRRQLRQGVRDARESRQGGISNDTTRRSHATVSSPSVREGEERSVPRGPLSAREISETLLQRELVGALLDAPSFLTGDEAKQLEELLTSGDLRSILHAAARRCEVREQSESAPHLDASSLLAELGNNPFLPWLEERLAVQKYDEEGAKTALTDGIPRLAKQNIERDLPKLQRGILEARRQGDDARANALTQERDALSRSAHRLMQGTKR